MITFSEQLIALLRTYDPRAELVYIYELLANNEAFYVGSTGNPASRYLGHLSEDTKDTRTYIRWAISKGRAISMRVIDIAAAEHRLTIESKWINEAETASNTQRYIRLYAKYKANPKAFRHLMGGTLTAPAAAPQGDAIREASRKHDLNSTGCRTP